MLPEMLPRPPAISVTEYQQRRDALIAQLPNNAAVVLPGAGLITRSRDSEFAFRQRFLLPDRHSQTGRPAGVAAWAC